MNISVERVDGPPPVSILRLSGDLDARSYESLIETGRREVDEGATHLIIDLEGVPYMGSSGLVALHSITLLLAGEEPPDPEHGWGAHHARAASLDGGIQDGLRLVAPQPSVRRVLERTGMTRFIEVHDSASAALAAFATS